MDLTQMATCKIPLGMSTVPKAVAIGAGQISGLLSGEMNLWLASRFAERKAA